MPENSLCTFPGNMTEALTMLYLQNKDLSKMSATELVTEYYNTFDQIRQANKEIRNTRNSFKV